MPPTPVDDHPDEFEQLAALAALDVLDGEKKASFDEHAGRCERCRLMVQLDREALARAAPEMDPSPDFKARLMQRAAQELATADAPIAAPADGHTAGGAGTPTARAGDAQTAGPVDGAPTVGPADAPAAEPAQPREPSPLRPEALPPNVVPLRRWRAPRWASALAAVFVVGILAVGGYSYQNQVVASYTLEGSLPGSAVVVVRRSGAAELQMRGVGNPPPGLLYEAWIIPPGAAPVAAGTASSGDATLPLNGLPPGATVAITQERQRVDTPTPPIVLAVQL
jgi:anti-sigma-K factor RskA